MKIQDPQGKLITEIQLDIEREMIGYHTHTGEWSDWRPMPAIPKEEFAEMLRTAGFETKALEAADVTTILPQLAFAIVAQGVKEAFTPEPEAPLQTDLGSVLDAFHPKAES